MQIPSSNLGHVDKHIALEVLRNQHGFLTTVISQDLGQISTFLFGESVITQQLYLEVYQGTPGSMKARASNLLLAISERVKSDEDGRSFVLLVQALESEPASRSHAKKLVQFYKSELEKNISPPPVRETTPQASITEVRQRPGKGSANPGPASAGVPTSVNKDIRTVYCRYLLLAVCGIGGVVVSCTVGWNLNTQTDVVSEDCREVDSVNVLYDYLHEVGQWDILCARLGVDEGTIAEIKEDPQTSRKLYNCLKAFVDYGKPDSCYEKVVSVVCGPPFKKRKLGRNIALEQRVAVPSQCQ